VSTGEVLDPDAVAELRRARDHFDDPAFIDGLTALFRKNAPQRMDQIREAVAARDAASLERAAHTLKTNCAVFGATRMAGCCAGLEGAGSRADFDAAAALLADAEDAFPRALAAITALGTRG
jgi:HPt (histidine-containing phosphotransfer) domain-containing protein